MLVVRCVVLRCAGDVRVTQCAALTQSRAFLRTNKQTNKQQTKRNEPTNKQTTKICLFCFVLFCLFVCWTQLNKSNDDQRAKLGIAINKHSVCLFVCLLFVNTNAVAGVVGLFVRSLLTSLPLFACVATALAAVVGSNSNNSSSNNNNNKQSNRSSLRCTALLFLLFVCLFVCRWKLAHSWLFVWLVEHCLGKLCVLRSH